MEVVEKGEIERVKEEYSIYWVVNKVGDKGQRWPLEIDKKRIVAYIEKTRRR